MFGRFEQGAKKLKDCSADCTTQYRLQAQYLYYNYYSVCSIEGAVIVTSMNRFYQRVDIYYEDTRLGIISEYHGTVFVGVSFRDEKGITVLSNE
jgi:hypothetical protein